MTVLRFTNPTDLPAYGDWDFRVFPAEIALSAADMRDVYAAYLSHHRQYYAKIPKDWPRYAEAQRIDELHTMLSAACESRQDLTLDHEYVWSLAKGLMFEKRFTSIYCPECAQTFGPERCNVLPWAFGEDLAASGGRRVVCPAVHTLYSCIEWNS